jgi:hypothetical protein
LFPATAVDNKENNLEYVWRISKGNSFRLMFLVSVLPTAANLIVIQLPLSNNPIYLIATSLFWLIIGVIEIGILSLSYDFLSKQNQLAESINLDKVEI